MPESSATALLLVDVINDLGFKGGDRLLRQAGSVANKLCRLKVRARRAGIPAIYVNDNFGGWTSDFQKIVENASSPRSRGKSITQLLAPDPSDYFVLKPKHSGFFSSTRELILKYLSASQLIITGFTTDSCVLFTSNDAYLRDYKLYVPRDCCTAISQIHHRRALEYMRRVLGADTRVSTELNLVRLAARK